MTIVHPQSELINTNLLTAKVEMNNIHIAYGEEPDILVELQNNFTSVSLSKHHAPIIRNRKDDESTITNKLGCSLS